MFSVLLLGAGTAHAVFGVADDVPAQDLVIPIICGVDAANGLDTLFAIAEVTCGDPISPAHAAADGPAVVRGHFGVYNYRSQLGPTFDWWWSCRDVESFRCKGLVEGDIPHGIPGMSPAQKAAMIQSIPPKPDPLSKDYYVGYVTLQNQTDTEQRFISWVYITDLQNGLANGFDGVAIEGGIDNIPGFKSLLREDGGNGPITAQNWYPRYFIMNDNPESFNWWIWLSGRNAYNCSGVTGTRTLAGNICNEEEFCPDFGFQIPDELFILDVNAILPSIHTGTIKAGFALLQLKESVGITSPPTSFNLTGTVNAPIPLCTIQGGVNYSMWGWAYQRAFSSDLLKSWDAIHPMHREYCNSPQGLSYITGSDCAVTP
jgi:hypothetical protein